MDIIERLRRWSPEESTHELHEDAADEIERLRKRVELLEGYLNGALNVVEGFVHCDTKEAREALEENA